MKKIKNNIEYFGFKKVTKDQKKLMISHVFSSVAKKYDLMNDLMSLGVHRIWKNRMIKYSNISNGEKVLDLAGGTGDLTIKFSNLVGKYGQVILLDINNSMLELGRDKIRNLGIFYNIFYIQADASLLPFLENSFDCVAIAFGLRNFVEKKKSLKSIYRILKPRGRLLILEFYIPLFKPLNTIYNFYSFYILPKIGRLVANDYMSYRYLAESIRMHENQKRLKLMMQDVGFQNVQYIDMSFGIVSLHFGYKL